MPTRDVERILDEWRELEREQQRLCDDGVPAGLEARIRQVRREYQEAMSPTPSKPATADPAGPLRASIRAAIRRGRGRSTPVA